MSDPITIHVRTNLYLWLLTGRAGDFQNSALNTGISYSVADTPPEVKELRSLLRLGDTTTDFHVLSVLAAARMSTSLLREMTHEVDAVFAPGYLSLQEVSANRTMLPPDGFSWPSIDGGRAGADGFVWATFRSLGGGDAAIETSAGGVDKTGYSLIAEDGGASYRLTFAKAEEYGIRAHFRVTSWAANDEVTVRFSPSRYPFLKVATALARNSTATRMMNAEDTFAAFAETSNVARKVGLAGLAVIRRMLRYINDDQAGFEVSTSFDPDAVEPLQKVYGIESVFEGGLDKVAIDDEQPVGFDV